MTRRDSTLPLFVEAAPVSGPVCGGAAAGQFDPASDEEAAALGRALLAELRGETLTPSQRALLLRSRSRSTLDTRAPTPVVDESDTLLVLARGDGAEVRVSWRRYRGSSPFLDIRRFERVGAGQLRPTRQGVTIRARELGRLMSTLVGFARRAGLDDDDGSRD